MITINGKTYKVNNLTIKNGEVWIDGKKAEEIPAPEKEIYIIVQAVGAKIEVDTCDFIRVEGDAQGVISTNGNVLVEGSITGNVNTVNGNVKAATIGGHVTTVNGDVSGGK
jgi:hypothetical protein